VTLDLYPSEAAALGFDIAEYRRLCRQLAKKADRDFAHKTAVGFGPQDGRAAIDAGRQSTTRAERRYAAFMEGPARARAKKRAMDAARRAWPYQMNTPSAIVNGTKSAAINALA